MKLDEIKSPLSSLQGVGPALSKAFSKLNLFTVGDLLKFYPKDYDDRRNKNLLKDFERAKVHTVAKVESHEWFGFGRMKTLKIHITDGSANAALICFNRPFMQNAHPQGSIMSVTGTFFFKYGEIQSTSFEAVKIADEGKLSDFENIKLPDSAILPIYPLTEGLTQTAVRKTVNHALNQYNRGIETEIPEHLMRERNILSKSAALKNIHQPESLSMLNAARQSIIYEELFNFQKTIAQRALRHRGEVPDAEIEFLENPDGTKKSAAEKDLKSEPKDFKKELSPLQLKLYESLSFDLTDDQKSVILQMNLDIDRGYLERNQIIVGGPNGKIPFTMQRLLQGDVGSGKTLVAFFACLRVLNWKGQCAFMAPTEILARQHAESAAKLLECLGVKVAFLTGNVKSSGRRELLKALKDGSLDIVIGTHALFSQDVRYKDLQLAIIDEQHRFGVVQRELIVNKGRRTEKSENISTTYEPHLLMMSATPIPQTLALTVFGDLDVSTIKTMPKGRLPVQTYLVKEGNEKNAYKAVREELKKGRQAYFVYPAIDGENASKNLKNVMDAFENLSKNVYPEFRAALLHSKIDEEEQIRVLKEFQSGKIQVLAATTVIEVGVDVPNATSIVIEAADRFGMAQLHQLRGRVGRGSEKSYCYLIYSDKITETGIERMKVLRQNTDGFFIAEQDLKLRGPGEINGTVQAGELELGLSDLERDKEILVKARYDAFSLVKKRLHEKQ